MLISISDLTVSLSSALDYVEKELLGVADHHSQRIAYLCYRLGETLNFSKEQCVAVAEAAILHDNALKEFVEDESYINEQGKPVPKHDEQFMPKHCIAREQNIERLPFYPLIKGAVLYHHERADGRGAFGKLTSETPLPARLIHIADVTDTKWDLSEMTEDKAGRLRSWLNENKDSCFDADTVDAFAGICTFEELSKLTGENSVSLIRDTISTEPENVRVTVLLPFAAIFAKITDYKSRFTCTHSQGIAEKARIMAEYYAWDKETVDKMYIAGALHDIGKLTVHNDILEKPGKLLKNEYIAIQQHAQASYEILSSIRGFEDITRWASMHHEKLDGSGYPFGKTADELGHQERLMACLDIYQALREERPYKAGMAHVDAMLILRKMAEQAQLDNRIVDDIDRCFQDS